MPTATTVPVKMAQRRDTAANWTSANPTLLAGEIGIESDTNKIKIGDGSTAWTSLAYRPWSQISAYPIVNADIASAAAIVDTKLATIATAGKVSNSATTAASANTASAIVARDASGNFTAGTITAALTGTASNNLPLSGGTLTGNVILDNQVDARFREATANGTNYVGFQAPSTIAADVLWTLPATDGTSNQVLKTDGAGTLSWSTPTAGGVSLGLVIALS